MVNALYIPKSLLEAITFYSSEQNCFEMMKAIRWPNGVVSCPRCGDTNVTLFATRPLFKCNGCKKQFSVKVGTIFEDSPLSFTKWLPALWLIGNAKNGISSCELARSLDVTQKTAWFMLHRIRHAMQAGTFEKLDGTVEVDETAIGGREKNKHVGKRNPAARGNAGKAIVQAFLERGDDGKGRKARAAILNDVGGPVMKGNVRAHVETGANLFTDGARQYRGLDGEYNHEFVDHAVKYVEGQVHTNGLENFFSLLKRSINGTYVAVEPYHLIKYVDEQTFRYNERAGTDGERFVKALSMVTGKRITYDELTGAYEEYAQYLP